MFRFYYVLVLLLLVNTAFASITYTFFDGEISNAKTFVDYFYYGIVTTSSVGYGDMSPTTQKAKVWVTTYLLLCYSFVIYLSIRIKPIVVNNLF